MGAEGGPPMVLILIGSGTQLFYPLLTRLDYIKSYGLYASSKQRTDDVLHPMGVLNPHTPENDY